MDRSVILFFRRSLLTVTALGGLSLAQAAPAPWYWWSSKTSDARICAQTSPGDGWEQGKKAYLDARCSIEKN